MSRTPTASTASITATAATGRPSAPTSPRGSVLTYAMAVSGFQSDYNIVVNRFSVNGGTTTITLSAWRTKTGQDLHSAISDPAALFVDPANNDYRLKPGSPAANAG